MHTLPLALLTLLGGDLFEALLGVPDDPPEIIIEARLPGADPREVEAALVRPLEAAIAGTPGVSRIWSVAREGGASLTLTSGRGLALDALRARVSAAPLPEGARALVHASPPPTHRLSAPDVPGALEARVEAGLIVARCGAPRVEIHVEVDPRRAAAFGVEPLAIAKALKLNHLLHAPSAIHLRPSAPQPIHEIRLGAARIGEMARVEQVTERDCRCFSRGRARRCAEIASRAPPPEARAMAGEPARFTIWPGEVDPRRVAERLSKTDALIWAPEAGPWTIVGPLEEIAEALSRAPGLRVDAGRRRGEPRVDVWVLAEDAELRGVTVEALAARLRQLEGVRAVDVLGAPPRATARLQIDRERAARFGLSPTEILEAARLHREGIDVGRRWTGAGWARVRLEIDGGGDAMAWFDAVTLPSARGRVPLSALATLTLESAPASIERLDGQRVSRLRVHGIDSRRASEALGPLPEGVTVRLDDA